MPLWGSNNQSVTANSTTTKMTTRGAPIGASRLVKAGGGDTAHYGNTSGSRAAAEVALFQNTTPGAFVSGLAVGVFGTNTATEQSSHNINHAGWNVRRAGTGPVVSITYTGTATGYSNTDVITVTSNTAGGNAQASFTTNSTGGALTITITNPGFGFTVTNPTVTVTNSTGGATGGSGATFAATAGGRAGRVHYETLVAGSSIT